MSKSYCDSGMILAVKEDSEYSDTVKSLADCDGLKVAVKEGATSYNVAQSFLDKMDFPSVQGDSRMHLLAGRVDVVKQLNKTGIFFPRNMKKMLLPFTQREHQSEGKRYCSLVTILEVYL